jgi:hypothetical protein
MTETKQTVHRLSPSDISYSQTSISPVFRCGRSIYSTLDAVWTGQLDVDDIPPITVFLVPGKGDDYNWCSLDNRRLWVWKQLEQSRSKFQVPVYFSSELPPKKKRHVCSQVTIRPLLPVRIEVEQEAKATEAELRLRGHLEDTRSELNQQRAAFSRVSKSHAELTERARLQARQQVEELKQECASLTFERDGWGTLCDQWHDECTWRDKLLLHILPRTQSMVQSETCKTIVYSLLGAAAIGRDAGVSQRQQRKNELAFAVTGREHLEESFELYQRERQKQRREVDGLRSELADARCTMAASGRAASQSQSIIASLRVELAGRPSFPAALCRDSTHAELQRDLSASQRLCRDLQFQLDECKRSQTDARLRAFSSSVAVPSESKLPPVRAVTVGREPAVVVPPRLAQRLDVADREPLAAAPVRAAEHHADRWLGFILAMMVVFIAVSR